MARIVSVGSASDAADVRLVRPAPTSPASTSPTLRVVPIVTSDPVRFARAYVGAIASGATPLIINPELPEKPREALLERVDTAPALGHVLCTSGTTRADGVPGTYFFDLEAALGNARAHLQSIGGASGRFLLPTPIWHSFGVVAGFLGTIACDGELYAFERTPDPKTIVQTLEQHAIETLYLNPMLARLLLLAAKRRPLPSLPALKRVSIGAATMTRGELSSLMTLLPNAQFYFTYGLTEMGPRVTTYAASRSLADEPGRSVPIGKPIAGVTCTVKDDRLVVSSPYRARDLDPEFVTADAATLLPSGDFEVRGRIDQVIVTGGLNVYAEDLERVALSVPGISNACAVGVPSDLYGEVVVLLCVGDAEAKSALDAAFATSLPPTHAPKAIQFVPALPMTSAGKVLRREAKALASK